MSVSPSRRATRRWLAVASAVTLVVAGCSSGGSTADGPVGVTSAPAAGTTAATSAVATSAAGTSAAATSAAGTSAAGTSATAGGDCGPAIKIGIVTEFTGELGQFGTTSKEGFDYAVKQVKDSGALPAGWTIETVVGDGKTNPQEALRVATAMVQNDKVSAILGPSSGPIMAMVKLSERYQVPIISQFAGTVNLDSVGGKWLYRTVASDTSDGLAAAKWLTESGAKSVVLLVQNDESTVSPARVMEQTFSDSGGKVLASVKYNAGQPSYQTVVQQAVDAHPDAIFLAGGQESGVTIMKELVAAGFSGDKVLTTADMAVPEVITALGADIAEGMQTETPMGDDDRKEFQDFSAAFKADLGHEPGLFVANAYDALILVALAAVAAGSTCSADVNAHLREVANAPGTAVTNFADGAKALADGQEINYEGASGPVDFDETGTVAGSYAIMKVTGGVWQKAAFYSAEVFTHAAG